jgi:hypothetical protein
MSKILCPLPGAGHVRRRHQQRRLRRLVRQREVPSSTPATGACYGDLKLLRICVCESPCPGEADGALTPQQNWLSMLS